jgi:hypothetical protein
MTTTTSSYASFLGQTKEHVVAQVGTPLQEKIVEKGIVLQYGSTYSSTLANYVYIENGTVSYVSQSMFMESKQYNEFLSLYGTPERVSKEANGNSIISIWAKRGVSITSLGVDTTSQVIRINYFAPTNVETYVSTWQKNIENQPTITLPTPTPSDIRLITTTQTTGKQNTVIYPILFGSAGIVLLCIFIFLSIKIIRNRKKPIPPTVQPTIPFPLPDPPPTPPPSS